MRAKLLRAFAALCGLMLAAPVSAQGVKIGILNDQSGVYADYGGKYSFEAAKMAVEISATVCWAKSRTRHGRPSEQAGPRRQHRAALV